MKIDTMKKFIFNKAEYLIEDTPGAVLLRVDYYHNSYEIEQQSNNMSEELIQKIHKIAKSLLKRKHGVNFVERVTSMVGQ